MTTNIKELIPKDKSDVETAEKLFNYKYDEIKTIIPELLACLQDMNWPIASMVAEYLITISDKISEELIEILNGDDDIWKYWCIKVFGWNGKYPLDKKVIDVIKRIAENPTSGEINEEVNLIAKEVLNK